MAKKKSKTQKYKKSQKKKLQKLQAQNTKKEKPVVKEQPKEKSIKKETPIVKEQPKQKSAKQKQLVSKENVKYNVVLNKEINKTTQKKSVAKSTTKKTTTESKKVPITKNKVDSKKSVTKNNIDIIKTKLNKVKQNITDFFQNLKKKFKNNNKFKKNNTDKKLKISHKLEKEIKKTIPKTKTEQNLKKKNIIIRLFYEIKNNFHIFFNTLIIITFIILLIGLIRIDVLKTGTIVYICCIVLFLMLVAISYNRYLSGKIFTLIITAGMCLGIYYMQYTYDFIRNLNSNVYEYKTYYVVTFNTTINRSIYTINNKKVGLLKDNCINIERKLNTKLDKVNYIEYDDINELYDDFYSSKFKAILVNENQYNYLKNNIHENSRDVKILYEFKANAKK